MRLNKNKAGFTLTEVVVTIAIIAIMISAALVSLNNSRNQKQVEMEARKVVAVIKEAQNNALTGKVLNFGEYPCSYKIEGNSPDTFVASYEWKSDVGKKCESGDVESPKIYGNFSLENGVAFSDSNFAIFFTVPFGTASGTGVNQAITLAKAEYSSSFCVCFSGKVVENGDCASC